MRSSSILLISALLWLGCCGGGGLPDYAAPRGGIVDPSQVPTGSLIPYRALARGDFQGAEPPAAYLPYRDRVGAATCAYLLSVPGTRLEVTPLHRPDEEPRYEARAVGLGFQAFMDRSCSWWNTEQAQLPADYVLQHEQIHFALFEIEARSLDARAEAISDAAVGVGGSPQEAAELARQRVELEIDAALRRALERNRKFDEDTSFGYRPERQRVWWERVAGELGVAR